mgnify:CR=1 FL=1
MCIFSRDITAVSATKIFARMEANKQAIVYEMVLATSQDTAMVLPIPIAQTNGGELVEFVDLSAYDDLFKDIEDLFPKTRTKSFSIDAPPAQATLVVHQVGAFQASFVPSQQDFDRLDERFRLNTAVLEKLPMYADYGFVVFQLRKGEAKIHPMAFWFVTRDINQLYFPTVHVHDGQVHDHEKFDHILYGQGNVHRGQLTDMTYRAMGSEKLKNISDQSVALVAHDSEVFKKRLQGKLENKDTWFEISKNV